MTYHKELISTPICPAPVALIRLAQYQTTRLEQDKYAQRAMPDTYFVHIVWIINQLELLETLWQLLHDRGYPNYFAPDLLQRAKDQKTDYSRGGLSFGDGQTDALWPFDVADVATFVLTISNALEPIRHLDYARDSLPRECDEPFQDVNKSLQVILQLWQTAHHHDYPIPLRPDDPIQTH